jgi:hypothetical protein
MAETNIGWHHTHLQSEFRQILRRFHQQSKAEFGSPSHAEDQSPSKSPYQPGGMIQLSLGPITTTTFGKSINDPTGLGRWKGTTYRGSGQFKMSVITAYRTCGGNIRTLPLGSTFSREFNYFRRQGHKSPNPRRLFFHHLEETIVSLQSSGNSIVLMLDANSDYKSDTGFASFLATTGLSDLYRSQPPPSTYIGAQARRIDYIFGCERIATSCIRSGALAYTEGPQSDHRGLFVDLEINELCQSLTPQKMSIPIACFLHTKNPELVSSYITHMKEYYTSHIMFARLQRIVDQQHSLPKDTL